MIRVYYKPQDLNTTVILATENCDGVKRYWYADDIKEFHRWWWEDDYDGPAPEDEVLEFALEGKPLKGMNTFEDIVKKFAFRTFEFEPGEVKIYNQMYNAEQIADAIDAVCSAWGLLTDWYYLECECDGNIANLLKTDYPFEGTIGDVRIKLTKWLDSVNKNIEAEKQ